MEVPRYLYGCCFIFQNIIPFSFHWCFNIQPQGSPGDDIVMTENEIEHELVAEAESAWALREWSIQHVLFPSMRFSFKPPNSMATNGAFVRVASLEKLYRTFGRC
ncbi:hypothetical protein ACFX2H_013800 [Malus domestica]